MSHAFSLPEPGQLVDVRRRRYVVVDITQSILPPDILSPGSLYTQPQHLVTLASVEDDAPGLSRRRRCPTRRASIRPSDWIRFSTRCAGARHPPPMCAPSRRPSAAASTSKTISLTRWRAIQMPRVNLLIAYGVGLGKTIEAGLVAQELIIRHRARRILIIYPAALQVQWHDQMRDKFGLEFRIVDSKLIHDLRRERGLHFNPWTHFPRLTAQEDGRGGGAGVWVG